MSAWLDPFANWLADVYLLSSCLLFVGLLVIRRLKQPAARMAVARSIAIGLAVLALVAASPRWPRAGWPQSLDDDWPQMPKPSATTIETEARAMPPAIERPTAVLPQTPVVSSTSTHAVGSVKSFELPAWRAMLASGFLIAAGLNLAWLALGAVEAARLLRSARRATSRLPSLLARVGGDRRCGVSVRLSTRIDLPVAIGVMRPTIVLPEDFAEREPDERLESAIAHELAHIRNGDLRWLAVLRLLNVLLFAQPLFWWLRRAIAADQEALADAAASTLHGDGRLAYAETLVGWARSSVGRRPGALATAALALWQRPSLLERRVRVLLDPEFRVEPAVSRRWRLATVSLGLVGALALSFLTVRPIAATAQVMKAPTNQNSVPSPASRKNEATPHQFEYAGHVIDSNGKPVPGAKLHLAYFRMRGENPPPVLATSDAQGRFRFNATKSDFLDTDYENPWTTAILVARSDEPRYGLGRCRRERPEEDRRPQPYHPDPT